MTKEQKDILRGALDLGTSIYSDTNPTSVDLSLTLAYMIAKVEDVLVLEDGLEVEPLLSDCIDWGIKYN